MKRRDFLEFVSAGAVTATLPAALTRPAYGKYHRSASGEISEWQQAETVLLVKDDDLDTIDSARKSALHRFGILMESEGFTEIRDFCEEVVYLPGFRKWQYLAICRLR